MKEFIIKPTILATVLIVVLTSCATAPPPEIKTVTKIERVIIKPPAELLQIPPQDFPIDTEMATQRTIAEWILRVERRSNQMEDQLKALKKFFKEIN